VPSRIEISPVVARRTRRRVFVPNEKKLLAIEEYEDLLLIVDRAEARAAFSLVFPRISFVQMLRWRRRVDELRLDCASAKLAKKFVSGRSITIHSEAWFPAAEALVIANFRDARAEGLKCDCQWLTVAMKAALLKLYPDGSADDFTAGDSWRSGFCKRFNLTMRVATNVMPTSVTERIPKCLRFFSVIQQVCAEGGGMNQIWGVSLLNAGSTLMKFPLNLEIFLHALLNKRARRACGSNIRFIRSKNENVR